MLCAVCYVSWNNRHVDAVRALLMALFLVAACAVGMVAMYAAYVVLAPLVVAGCCAAAPVVGQLVIGGLLIALFAKATMPRR